jgi:uncharacterized membrane protein YjfL (UPF0719 family)
MLLFAQDTSIWSHLYSIGIAVLSMLSFGLAGIFLAILGFWLFDKFTPGKLDEEILHKQNVAAAIVGAAVILGICMIVAAAIRG